MCNVRPFSVLLTSTSPKKFEFVKLLKHNPDNADVRVYCTNACKNDLLSSGLCDGSFLVPRFDSVNYVDSLLEICSKYHINILMPRLSYELLPISASQQYFDDIGTKLALDTYQHLSIVNDKNNLYNVFGEYMPQQIIANSQKDIISFYNKHHIFCCKLSNAAGSEGFAIVDDNKCDNVELFHSYGNKHYISLSHFIRIVENQNIKYILQEYINGIDYSVSILANKGKITSIVGYYGYEMEFSCIMRGEIAINEKAYQICENIVSKLELNGILGVDFIINKGNVYLLEVNPRLTASLPFVAAAGVNMPYLYCKHLLGYGTDSESLKINYGLKMRKYYETLYSNT